MSRSSSRIRSARKLVVIPTRVSARAVGVSTRITLRSLRFAVRSSIVAFVLGLGVGWFLTTPTGRYLLGSVRDLLAPAPVAPPDDESLAAAVRSELAAGSSTWHLAQPSVGVQAGRITLTGTVPHQLGREALLIVAAGVPGALAVVDQLEVVVDPHVVGTGAGSDTDRGPDRPPVR